MPPQLAIAIGPGLDQAKSPQFRVGASPQSHAAISPNPSSNIMDLRPSHGLAAGLKRVGGRGGISRLGRSGREAAAGARHGRPIVSHRF